MTMGVKFLRTNYHIRVLDGKKAIMMVSDRGMVHELFQHVSIGTLLEHSIITILKDTQFVMSHSIYVHTYVLGLPTSIGAKCQLS